MLKEFSYVGPVMVFDTCVERSWKASSMAESKIKALSNLTYRYKKEHNLPWNYKVELTGEIKSVS